ncbi:hypothetical protein [Chryseolinea serpens]|uniref:hypothetical protein n=1 Tax=Chryseolinea serpens TaxID=947013 RepID=UPI0009336B06|nr:hypothetical protein [Chryseolinea serpens]
MELKIVIELVLLVLIALAGGSYSIFVAYPFHKKRLEAATDDEERRYIRSTIIILVGRTIILIVATIIFMWIFLWNLKSS